MNQETLLTIDDNPQSAILKLSRGNPGAIVALTELTFHAPAIDGDSVLGAFGPLLAIDMRGLRADRIWMLYSDVCNRNIERMLAVIRGWQLGLLDWDTVDHAIDNRGAGLDTAEVLAKVKDRLPLWTSPAAEEALVG